MPRDSLFSNEDQYFVPMISSSCFSNWFPSISLTAYARKVLLFLYQNPLDNASLHIIPLDFQRKDLPMYFMDSPAEWVVPKRGIISFLHQKIFCFLTKLDFIPNDIMR